MKKKKKLKEKLFKNICFLTFSLKREKKSKKKRRN